MSEHAVRKPSTVAGTVEKLWWIIAGNGQKGLVQRVEHLEEQLGEVNTKLDILIQGCPDAPQAQKANPRRLDLLAIVVAILVGAQTLGLTEMIRRILFSLLSGSPE